jgi:hypothetical protein
MMKRVLIFGVIALVLGSTGCKKEDVEPNVLLDFYGFWDQIKTSPKTYLMFSFSSQYGNPEMYSSNVTASIFGDKEPFALNIDTFNLSFPDYYYSQNNDVSTADTNQHMISVYGKYFDLKFGDNYLNAKSDGSIVHPGGEVYIPKLLYPVSYENLTTDGKLVPGTTIKWSADDNNKHGIYLGIEYYPSLNDSANKIDFPDYIRRGKILEDLGEYTFTKSDFTDFPPQADLDFCIERIGYTTFKDENGEDCTFASIEKSIAGFTISIAK